MCGGVALGARECRLLGARPFTATMARLQGVLQLELNFHIAATTPLASTPVVGTHPDSSAIFARSTEAENDKRIKFHRSHVAMAKDTTVSVGECCVARIGRSDDFSALGKYHIYISPFYFFFN